MKLIFSVLLIAISLSAFSGAKRGSPRKVSQDFDALIAQTKDMESVSYAELQEYFEYVRDTKFFDSRYFDAALFPTEKRRIPWFDIGAGCQVRAHISAIEIEKKFNKLAVKTVYIFRDASWPNRQALKATLDILDKNVGWLDYHVALAVKVDDQIYMIDPPFDFSKPITLEKWRDSLTRELGPKKVSYSLCHGYSTDAYYGSCANGDLNMRPDYILNELKGGFQRFGQTFPGYLNIEAMSLKKGIESGEYKNDLEYYLGDIPPWK